MSKLFVWCAALPLVFAATSCSVDIEFYDSLSDENALLTEDDLSAAVTGIYHEFRQGGWGAYNCAWGSLLTMQVGCTDEVDCNFVWEPQMDFLWTPQTGEWMPNFYLEFVPAVTKITSLLDRMRPLSIAAPVKRRYNAELRTIRAIFAYDLYDLYGPIPLVLDPAIAATPESSNAWKPERPSVEEYLAFVESELHDVQDNLPYQNELKESEWGRMTVGIAQMYLLKLFMHEAGQERHYRTGDEAKVKMWWEKADSLTNVMIAKGDYSLQKDYMSVWAPDNQKNSEVIFPIVNFPQGGLGNIFLAETLPADYVSQNGTTLTKWGGFLSTWETFDSYADGDYRRSALKEEYWNGKKMVNRRTDAISGKSAPFPMKYQENPSTTGQWDASDYVIHRWSEVIMARAEALNELYGPTAEVKSLLHQIRSRAFDNYVGSVHEKLIDDIDDKDVMRDHILDERRWEFCWEGMRRPDLIRHGKLISNAHARGKVNAEDKHILYCIPQSVRYENPNIDQNPGWN